MTKETLEAHLFQNDSQHKNSANKMAILALLVRLTIGLLGSIELEDIKD